ncbi:MAG: molybdate ABC transporter substrate-binding protein, partial [Pseudomonadota bacterium]|nr:molybdate ABC transporter substrate-binding protein [Pseudomonadota bacterium]
PEEGGPLNRAPRNSILSNPISFSELTYLIQKNKLTRFAIPNTEHCSYGRAAREVLMKMKVWVKMQPEVVPALNTYRAAQTSLNADGGIIPYSLAISPEFKNHGQFIIIPQDLYHPIQQEMILLKNANKTAIRFYNWLQSPEARFIFRQNGYDTPQN